MKFRFGSFGTVDRWLVAFSGACTVTLVAELIWPHRLDAPNSPPHAEVQAAADVAPARQVGALGDYQAIADQPIFAFDRRPYLTVAEDAVPASPPGPKVEFELTALIIADSAQFALLRSNLTPTVQRLSIDQSLDGWTLVEVWPQAVVLRRGAETLRIELHPTRAGGQNSQAARLVSLADGN